MHTSRPLPHSSRSADSPNAGRRHPHSPVLVTGTARASEPARRGRLLSDLASDALDVTAGTILIAEADGTVTALDPPSQDGLAMIGLRCPPEAIAVATSAPCETRWPDGSGRRGVVAWSVSRQGHSAALFRERSTGGVEVLSSVAGTLLDAALRALGQDTAPCPAPAVHFPDGVFLHRVERLLDRRGGRCRRPQLDWHELSVLHPLNGSGEHLSSCLVRALRQDFHDSHTWSSLREGVVGLPATAPAVLPGLTPQIAGWLDDGAFARWVLSRLPDVRSTLERLCGRLGDPLADQLSIALGGAGGRTAPEARPSAVESGR